MPHRNLWIIGTTASKDQVAALLTVPKPGPGYCHFPAERADWWFEQMTSEHAVRKFRRGRAYHQWETRSKGRPTEAWDCRRYGHAAYIGIQAEPFSLDIEREAARIGAMQPAQSGHVAPARPRRHRRRVSRSTYVG